MNDFKTAYRSLDALLIDDIQFFAGKERSQEEFFHTFNALLEGQQQVILTCDRYPKESKARGTPETRFGWGLTVADRAARSRDLRGDPEARRRSLRERHASGRSGVLHRQAGPSPNVRELETLRRVIANLAFHGPADRGGFGEGRAARRWHRCRRSQVTIENIQKPSPTTTGARLPTFCRSVAIGSIARPRQVRWHSPKI